jgi:hypothetical protein
MRKLAECTLTTTPFKGEGSYTEFGGEEFPGFLRQI